MSGVFVGMCFLYTVICNNSHTPLIIAARYRHRVLVQKLISAKADVNAVNQDGYDIFHFISIVFFVFSYSCHKVVL